MLFDDVAYSVDASDHEVGFSCPLCFVNFYVAGRCTWFYSSGASHPRLVLRIVTLHHSPLCLVNLNSVRCSAEVYTYDFVGGVSSGSVLCKALCCWTLYNVLRFGRLRPTRPNEYCNSVPETLLPGSCLCFVKVYTVCFVRVCKALLLDVAQ